jgi:type I restriction enzyme R subunit
MQEHNLVNEPQEVYNLKGDAARIAFVQNFKEVQRFKTQLRPIHRLRRRTKAKIEAILPKETLQEFRSSYIETAKQLREIQQKEGDQCTARNSAIGF